jgi:hypothetical protein
MAASAFYVRSRNIKPLILLAFKVHDCAMCICNVIPCFTDHLAAMATIMSPHVHDRHRAISPS